VIFLHEFRKNRFLKQRLKRNNPNRNNFEKNYPDDARTTWHGDCHL